MAEDQNWSISQDRDGVIYFANNKGLLSYNSARWELFPTPNQSILRSVCVINDKIYSGSYMDFGYWGKDNLGGLTYKSLTSDKDFKIKEDEEFWDIVGVEDYILFQSLDRIYIYNVNADSFKIIDSRHRINKIFKTNETIYFQKEGYGIYEIQNGSERLVIPEDKFSNNEIINIYSIDNDLLLLTKERGLFIYSEGVISIWNSNANKALEGLSIYNSIRLSDGSFLFGTISEGIIQLSSDGKKILKINKSDGLSNNTVLSLLEDNKGNIWLGLNNGINIMNLDSPYLIYKDKQGVLGTIYTSIKVDNYLYLGSNQGLFFKRYGEGSNFNFIEGTKGQVWSLNYLKGEIFCGHDKGTFIVKNGKANLIKGDIGTWAIKEIKDKPNLLLQGNYKGLSILEKKNEKWNYRNKIDGFNISSRYLDFIESNQLLISHEYKGVYKLNISSEYKKIMNYEKLGIDQGPKSSIIKYQNSILYSNRGGVYIYNKPQAIFYKDSTLSSIIEGDSYVSGKLIYDDNNNRLWCFSESDIIFVEPGKLSEEPKINKIPIPNQLRNSKVGYENILSLADNKYLVGTADGYLTIDLDKHKQSSKSIGIDKVSYRSLHDEFVLVNINKPIELDYKSNSILFRYSVTDYNKFSATKYKYRLLGFYDKWSNWSSESQTYIENLPHGSYKFEVKALSSGEQSNNIASYEFSIEKPWYLHTVAIIFYVLLGLALIFLIQYFNNKYYKRENKN
ncbi:hypothetical protein WPG_0801 [Winogradskyella sp. PG-2]|nr:hypothetical protein WPG_0801 [Winogradskyella sp. PG-2]